MTLDGTWRCRGYGRTLVILGSEVRWYDTTAVSRIEAARESLDDVHRDYDRVDRTGDRLALFDACGITRYDFDAAPALDGGWIVAGTGSDPIFNFRVFWQTFAEHYAFFDLRGVDWHATGRRLGGRLQSASTEAALRDALAEAIEVLGDGHVVLRAGSATIRSSRAPQPSLEAWWRREGGRDGTRGGFRAAMRGWLETQAGLRDATTVGAGQLIVGRVTDDVGYLGVLRMTGWAAEGDGCANVAAADQAVERAIDRLDGVRAIVVDVRFNGGGWDAVGLAIAARLADRERAVFAKQARDADGWTEPQPVSLTPSRGRRFTAPIALLISGSTASAAEVFAIAMCALPHVTLVGATTAGILSDELEKVLPNGWRFTLSNELYRSADGAVLEGTGVKPGLAVDPAPSERLTDYLRRGLDVAATAAAAGVE